MTSQLDIHAASHEELIAAHTNVIDIWSKGRPLEEHLRYRLESPSHSRATWYVGCLEGRVVVSLGCYPVHFHLSGQTVPGIAIGSVYTVKDCRGQGFAPQLLAFVEQEAQRRQTALSVLYSDIDPAYYARLGYVLCPSMQGSRSLTAEQIDRVAADRLRPIDGEAELATLMRLYDQHHGQAPLAFAREAEYWRHLFKKFPHDRHFAFQNGGSAWAGYLRVGINGDVWRITDFALADASLEPTRQLYAAFCSLAAAEGAKTIRGWLPDSAASRDYFEIRPRPVEITMVKPLAWSGAVTSQSIEAAGQFCEIDHV